MNQLHLATTFDHVPDCIQVELNDNTIFEGAAFNGAINLTPQLGVNQLRVHVRKKSAGNFVYDSMKNSVLYDSNVVVNANSNVTISANGVANVVTVTSVGGNITGNLSVSANTSANNFSANYNINIGNTALSWATLTTTSTSANQIITSLDANVIRGAEFLVKGEEATGGKYTVVSLSGIHNGTSANYAVYSSVNMGGQVGQLRVIYSSGLLSLAVTPATSNSTVWTTQYRMI